MIHGALMICKMVIIVGLGRGQIWGTEMTPSGPARGPFPYF
uniref:Uncharacterized protein n=1 Tax=Picea glauca TaxID=3330 RepID=A0A117NHY2_PICGL|nr:hypothetical protein ABT39_MTgene4422 [Picea glauca]